MAARQLDYGWNGVVARLATGYPGVVVVSAAYVRGEEGEWRPEAVTIRGGVELPPRDYDWGQLRIVRTSVAAGQAATVLLEREVGGRPLRMLAPLDADTSPAMWITQGADYGLIGPTSTPRLYHWRGWTAPQVPFNDYMPLAARGLPYYPTARTALFELLYGRTNPAGSASPLYRLELSLAYDGAYLGDVSYVQDQGLVVNVGGTTLTGPAGHELQVVWQLHLSDAELGRWSASVGEAGAFTVPIPAPPLSYAVALLDPSGNLIDQVEGRGRAVQEDETPLPPTALLDAFEFLDSAWRNFFGRRLSERPRLGGVADLSQPVGSQAEFSSRMTQLDNLMKALRVDNDLLRTKAALALPETATVGRMHDALRQVLSGPDLASVQAALDILSAANGVRVALQHKIDPTRRPDLPIALARLGIVYPPDWSTAWEIVRHRVVDAVGEIRRALLANLPT
jgi:hypothetical protein